MTGSGVVVGVPLPCRSLSGGWWGEVVVDAVAHGFVGECGECGVDEGGEGVWEFGVELAGGGGGGVPFGVEGGEDGAGVVGEVDDAVAGVLPRYEVDEAVAAHLVDGLADGGVGDADGVGEVADGLGSVGVDEVDDRGVAGAEAR